MKILYLHQYFKTPQEGGAIRSYYLATAMAAAGHRVELISGWNNRWEETKAINGFILYYVPVAYSNQLTYRQRKSSFLNYLKQARKKIEQLGKFDLAYVSSTPLTIGLLALYLKWIKRTPYVFEIRDLWPEAPYQLGAISFWQYRGLKFLEKILYQQAAGVVALSPPIQQAVNRLAPRTPTLLAPNMADTEYFNQPATVNLPLHSQNTFGKFIISYTGAAGPANGLEALVEAAEACQAAQLPVLFLVMAEGSELAKLHRQAKDLNNLKFLPYGSKEEAKACLQMSDAVYVSFAQHPVLQSCSPNKLFDGLAAGKLIITNTAGWLKELVENNGCGFYVGKNQSEEFIMHTKLYIENEKLLQQAQENARQLAIRQFSRDLVSDSVLKFLPNICK